MFGDFVEKATFANLTFEIKGTFASEILDNSAKTTGTSFHTSAFYLAYCVAFNWWRLRWEPKRGTLDWRMSQKNTISNTINLKRADFPAKFASIFRLLVFSILIGIPFTGLSWLISQLEQQSLEIKERQIQDDLRRILGKLTRQSLPEIRLQETGKTLVRAISQKEDFSPIFPPEFLHIYGFTSKGKRIMIPGLSDKFVRASEQFFSGLLKARDNPNTEMSRAQERISRSFFGGQQAIEALLDDPERVIPIPEADSPRMGGLFPATFPKVGKGFLLLHADSNKLPPLFLLNKGLSKLSRSLGNKYNFGFVPFIPNSKSSLASFVPRDPKLRKFILSEKFEGSGKFEGKIFHTVSFSSFGRIFASTPKPRSERWFELARAFIWLSGAELFLLFLWVTVFSLEFSIPLRLQLVFLFASASLAGVATLMGIAHAYQGILQESLLRENREFAGDVLEKADDSFIVYLNRYRKAYRTVIKRLEKTFDRYLEILSPIIKLQQKGHNNGIYLISADGKVIFRRKTQSIQAQKKNWVFAREESVPFVAKDVIRKFNRLPRSKSDRERVESDPYLKLIIEGLSEQFLQNLGEFYFSHLVEQSYAEYLEVIKNPDGKAIAILIVLHDPRFFEKEFLKILYRRIRNSGKKKGLETFFLGLPKEGSRGVRAFPVLKNYEEGLTSLQEKISRTRNSESELATFLRVPAVLTGLPGHFFHHFNLFYVHPYKPIESKLDRVAKGFVLLGGLILTLGIFLGLVFSHNLLGPINKLTEGIQNLLENSGNHFVDIESGDEFEALGDGINEVVENLKDLQHAQSIQEQLFPSAPLEFEQTFCQGWTRSPWEIGGEIYDFLGLENHRIALSIAGVSGHEVGSALFVAMIKMALRVHLNLNARNPTEVIQRIIRQYSKNVRQFQHFDFFLGFFDAKTSQLQFAGIGNFFAFKIPETRRPVRIDTDSKLEESGLSILSGSFSLPAGERMFIASAGLSETINLADGKRNEEFFDLIESWDNMSDLTFGTDLWEKLDRLAGGKPPDRGQTILLLRGENQ